MRFWLLVLFVSTILLGYWSHGLDSHDDTVLGPTPNTGNSFHQARLRTSVGSVETPTRETGLQIQRKHGPTSHYNVSHYKYEPIITECGGVFRIKPDTPIEIQYKLGRNYSNYEYCVWSIVPDSPSHSYDFHLVEGAFENDYDGITFYAWDGDKVISVTKRNDTSHTVRGDHVFMAFDSDGSQVRPGFRMRVTARSAPGSESKPFIYSAISIRQSEGEYKFPNPADQGRSEYVSNERFSAVLQFSNSSEERPVFRMTRIASLHTELFQDYVHAFPLKWFLGTASGTFHLT